ncbi:hypothetical protein PVE_R2G0939 [Pseudomonas veronii 1YdBTEX2]|uniref:Uncharacterized protein n=1 Tax=Pseudomonas veronii 1YdBTEX2 TaxID=1295141 RepID=A0A1D3K9C0_PSEVE|nr:hypothetical protein PVE_R2G0939 [Pseudomonas veronii 1YdBTEX2]
MDCLVEMIFGMALPRRIALFLLQCFVQTTTHVVSLLFVDIGRLQHVTVGILYLHNAVPEKDSSTNILSIRPSSICTMKGNSKL